MDHIERLGYTRRFFLSHPAFGEREVTKEEFIKAERAAGFCSKSGFGVATGGFRSGDIRGRVETILMVDDEVRT